MPNHCEQTPFIPSAKLLRLEAACAACFRSIEDLVLATEGQRAFNYVLKSQAKLIYALAQEKCEPDCARAVLNDITAGLSH